jgi:hypothetical protein
MPQCQPLSSSSWSIAAHCPGQARRAPPSIAGTLNQPGPGQNRSTLYYPVTHAAQHDHVDGDQVLALDIVHSGCRSFIPTAVGIVLHRPIRPTDSCGPHGPCMPRTRAPAAASHADSDHHARAAHCRTLPELHWHSDGCWDSTARSSVLQPAGGRLVSGFLGRRRRSRRSLHGSASACPSRHRERKSPLQMGTSSPRRFRDVCFSCHG